LCNKNIKNESEESDMSLLDKNQRYELMIEIKKKGLKLKDIAPVMGVSTSLISQYLNSKCNMDERKEAQLKAIVNQAKEYEYRKVYIE
jgi:predicted transcriptional regulator